MKKCKIIILNENFEIGGSKIVSESLFNSKIIRQKYHPLLVLTGGNIKKDRKKGDIYFIHGGKNNPLLFFKLLKLVFQNNIKLIHVHSERLCVYASLIKFFFNVKIIIHFHGPFNKKINKKNILAKKIRELIFINLTDKDIFISHDLFRKYKNYLDFNLNKVNIITNGSDDISMKKGNLDYSNELISSYDINKNTLVITTTGRLSEVKNYKYLILLADKLKQKNLNFRVFIAGIGEQKKKLTSLIKKFNLENKVILLGNIKNKDIPSLLSISNLFILTSKYEGISISVLEAMSMSIPCLLSDVGGNKEIIQNGENGYLFPLNNLKYLEDKIIFLYKNKELINNFGINSRTGFVKYYSIKKFHKNILRVYDSLLKC